MEHTPLRTFIAHARSKGMDHQTIRMLLLSSGWKEKDIVEALTEATLDMPVPAPEDRGGAKEAFYHLLAFVTLYASVISVLVLVFEYLNRAFPDAAFDYGYDDDSSSIRWFMAVLIVSFPIFVWMSRIIQREIAMSPERAWSPVRRWLTYLTLFVTAGVLVCDGITLLFYLLQGEITIRFILKVFAVLGVAGMVFSYYFVALKMPAGDERSSKLNRTYGIVAIVIALAAVVWGMVVAGTPMGQRLVRLDERRVNDLRTIQQEVYNIVYKGADRSKPVISLPNPLPPDLQYVVENTAKNRPSITDPVTGMPYEYDVDVGDSQFALCATFDTVRDQDYDVFWNHPAERHCYAFDALDPTIK